jgi:hypothetical protein
MSEFNIKTNCRIEELTAEEQLMIVRLVNHLASHEGRYRESCFERVTAVSHPSSYVAWMSNNPEYAGPER